MLAHVKRQEELKRHELAVQNRTMQELQEEKERERRAEEEAKLLAHQQMMEKARLSLLKVQELSQRWATTNANSSSSNNEKKGKSNRKKKEDGHPVIRKADGEDMYDDIDGTGGDGEGDGIDFGSSDEDEEKDVTDNDGNIGLENGSGNKTIGGTEGDVFGDDSDDELLKTKSSIVDSIQKIKPTVGELFGSDEEDDMVVDKSSDQTTGLSENNTNRRRLKRASSETNNDAVRESMNENENEDEKAFEDGDAVLPSSKYRRVLDDDE